MLGYLAGHFQRIHQVTLCQRDGGGGIVAEGLVEDSVGWEVGGREGVTRGVNVTCA